MGRILLLNTVPDSLMRNLSSWLLTYAIFLLIACSSEDELKVTNDDGTQNTTTVIPDLRVMTYNIHLANPPSKGNKFRDLPAIAKVIKESGADLIALQEVDRFTERSGVDVDQARELGRLTKMTAFFVKAMDVFGGGEYGIAILSKFNVLDSAGFELPAHPNVGGEMRKLAVVKVSLPDARELIFAATHLDHRSEENRLFQGERVIDILTPRSLPVILAGDFNALPKSLTIDLFDNNFKRTCRHNCPPTFPAHDPKSAIDFIMYRGLNHFEIATHKLIFETYASDHLPVIAGLKLN